MKGDDIIKDILIIHDEITKDFAFKAALITGNSRYCTVDTFEKKYSEFYYVAFIISKIEKNLQDFISSNARWLSKKKIMLYYPNEEKLMLKVRNIFIKFDVVLEKNFSKNKRDQNAALDFFMEIKNIMDSQYKECPNKLLKDKIEEFFLKHNTCTLCSCSEGRTIGTPIEYIYENGFMYFITEGGRKYFNILKNDKVLISVYEEYSGFNRLNGYQCFGKAEVIEDYSKEYEYAIAMKKLNLNNIKRLNIMLHVIKVKLERVDVISSEMKKSGYDVKQIYFFDK
ncbi:hypothetical protein NL50_04460 [Clostridium acetobutylicum]|nr:hypothetical protein NL50_04460 [Clostridium acetobutylicum]